MKKGSKEETVHRLKIIEGHLKKVRDMVEKDEYCPNILVQTSAVSSAIRKVDELILDSHLHTCVAPALKGPRANNTINEVLEVFKRR